MKILIILFYLSVSSVAFANGGDEVRNGGGFAEQYLTYALKTMPKTIERCLESIFCVTNPKSRELLKKIKASIPMEIDSEVLKFVSNQQRPGFFTIDGVERLSVTGNYVGSPIYYNLNLLYQYGDVRIKLGQAVQSLVHELGHHHGVTDHNSLEMLGSEVRRMVDSVLMEVPYYSQIGNDAFRGMSFNAMAVGSGYFNDSQHRGTLILVFKDNTFDMGMHFDPLLSQCDSTPERPTKKISMQFFNLHWNYKANEQTSFEKYLSGNVYLYCRDIYSRVHRKNFEFTLKIKTSYTDRFIFQSSELETAPNFLFTEKIKLMRDY